MVIDISVYQGEINWSQIKADAIELAIIKATEGIGFTDPRFAQNWASAKAAGVPRGAYHFAHPDAGNDAIAEASYFLGIVQAHGLDPADVLAEDYEVLGGGAAWSLGFLGHLESLVANLLAFYSNYSGCSRVNDSRMAAFLLWLAYPGDGVHAPICPKPWTSIALWQYRVGTVAGISGGVDEDVSLGLFAAGEKLILPRHHAPRRVIYMPTVSGLHQFLRGLPDGAAHRGLWHRRRLNGAWSAWALVGGGGNLGVDDIGEEIIGVGVDDQGAIVVTVTGSDNVTQFESISADNGNTWSGFAPANGAGDGLAVLSSPSTGASVSVDFTQVLSAIADLKAHPSFDPNDAATLAIVQKLEAAARAAGAAA